MYRIVFAVCAAVAAIFAGGCSSPAPQYSASMENVQRLKDAASASAKVGAFAASQDPANANPISLRASTLVSPYGGSYANYLAEAIKQDLALAGKLATSTDIEVSGMLMKNDIDISGFSTGYGNIEARFVVKKGDQVRYDQIKSAHSEWESSFAGAIAIPRGREEYPHLVQRLLTALYADEAFLKALQ